MSATRQINKKIDSLKERRHAIERAVRIRRVYALLRDKKTVVGNDGYCNRCYPKKCRHPKACRQWLNCCSAQGSCSLPPKHRGPHLQNGTGGWVIFSADRNIEAAVSELDERRLWPAHRRHMTSKGY